MPVSSIAPARPWRALFVFALLGFAPAHAAGPGGPGKPADTYLQFGEPDQAEGRRILEQFRRTGIAGDYYLEFDLRVMPRRGDEQVFHGRLWGGHDDQGAVLRVAVTDANGHERRLLIQNGEQAAVWRSDTPGDTPQRVESFEPLVPGVELTAFDLQMPYLYWPDARLEGVDRVRGRPAHGFLFRPPAAWAARHPDISGVRAWLDAQYHAPVQSELLDAQGRALRTLSLVDLHKVGDQYIVKTVDLRNEATRDKTRFQVTAAALRLDFSPVVFEPAHLGESLPPPAVKLQRIAP